MPELRKDPVAGRWVIIATERSQRPIDFKIVHDAPRSGICPFCPGNEDRTPPEIHSIRVGDGAGSQRNRPGWSIDWLQSRDCGKRPNVSLASLQPRSHRRYEASKRSLPRTAKGWRRTASMRC